MSEFSRYESLRDAGAPPRELYLAAKDNGFKLIDGVRMLIAVCGLDIGEAKGVCVEVDTGMTLDEYQESLLPDIKEALDTLEDDIK